MKLKVNVILCIFFFPLLLFANNPIRVAFANEDFGNWHFCGSESSHKAKCAKGDTLKGFNPELAKELFKRLGVNIEFVLADWVDSSFFKGLDDDNYDVIISNVAKKEDRKVYGIFSKEPYEPLNEIGDYFFYTMKSNEVSLKSIGAQKDSITLSFLQKLFLKSAIKEYASTEELVNSLIFGQTSAIFGSFSLMRSSICSNPNIIKMTKLPISLDEEKIDDRTYVLTAKRHKNLANQINIEIRKMHEDGTIQILFDRWLKKTPSCD